ncbi:AEC family transporter [Propionispora vibrioides]|uniref:Uncharacterized protein n=1 Tax=Propionispora vibrioides TaxID=112903 RepID=A0A1H8X8X7_9FIRM|nr:transporter [Propionispora vibrioides]SEP36362.1 hypothetical protein SAMN04490178_12135 [Propionispora vibrioides]
MDTGVRLLYFAADLLLPLVAGYLCCRRGWLSERVIDRIVSFNIVVVSTLLAALSFWGLTLDAGLVWLPVLGVGVSLIPGLLAYYRSGRKYGSELDQGSYLLAAALSNMGTVGGLCVFFMYGETGFAYTQLMTMFFNVVVFAVCFPLAQYYYIKGQSAAKPVICWSAVLFSRNQLPVVGLLAGMGLTLGGLPKPVAVSEFFSVLIHFGAWTALLPVGFSINFGEMKKYYVDILDLIPIKFVVTPLVIYWLAQVTIGDTVADHTALVLASTPPAINSVLTAKIHNLNVDIAMASFVVLTVLFLAVVYPVLFFWIMY